MIDKRLRRIFLNIWTKALFKKLIDKFLVKLIDNGKVT